MGVRRTVRVGFAFADACSQLLGWGAVVGVLSGVLEASPFLPFGEARLVLSAFFRYV